MASSTLSSSIQDKYCLLCNTKVTNVTKVEVTKVKRKRGRPQKNMAEESDDEDCSFEAGLSGPLAQVLCKALDIPAPRRDTFTDRFLHSPICAPCCIRVQGVKHTVLALELLERTVNEFRHQIIETLQEAHESCGELAKIQGGRKEKGQNHDISSILRAQNLFRKEIIDLLSNWKETYENTVLSSSSSTPASSRIRIIRNKDPSTTKSILDALSTVAAAAAAKHPDDVVIKEEEEEELETRPEEDILGGIAEERVESTAPEESPNKKDGGVAVRSLSPAAEISEKEKEQDNDSEYEPPENDGGDADDSNDDMPFIDDDGGGQAGDKKKERLNCALCKSRFMSFFSLDIHTKRVHLGMKQPYVCTHSGCKRAFRSRSLWKKHLVLHKDGIDLLKRFSCDLCSKKFESTNSLGRHRSTHTGKWKYPCPTCSKGFHRPSALATHKARDHDAQLPYPCPDCEQKFPTSRLRLVHRSTAHPDVAPPKLSTLCEICNKVFSGRDALRCHRIQVHPGGGGGDEKLSHKCDICSKVFAKKSWLARHHLQHTKEKTYHCDRCSESFRFPNSLAAHKLKHEGKLPWTCSQCGKGFRMKGACKTHELTHQGRQVKSHICEYCGRTFGIAVYLGHHLKRVHFKELGLLAKPDYFIKKKKKSSTTTTNSKKVVGPRRSPRAGRQRAPPSDSDDDSNSSADDSNNSTSESEEEEQEDPLMIKEVDGEIEIEDDLKMEVVGEGEGGMVEQEVNVTELNNDMRHQITEIQVGGELGQEVQVFHVGLGNNASEIVMDSSNDEGQQQHQFIQVFVQQQP